MFPRYSSVYFFLFIFFQFSCVSLSLYLYRVINDLMSLPPDLTQNKTNQKNYTNSVASCAEVITKVQCGQLQRQYTLMRLRVEDAALLSSLEMSSRPLATSRKRRKNVKKQGKMHPRTGTEALYRPYGPQGEKRYSSTLS